jgi:hypothetical protein
MSAASPPLPFYESVSERETVTEPPNGKTVFPTWALGQTG